MQQIGEVGGVNRSSPGVGASQKVELGRTEGRIIPSKGRVDGVLDRGGVIDRELRQELVDLLLGIVHVECDGVLEPC